MYINVYAPDVIDSNLPVMVWLYGGGFTAGSGTWGEYGPHKFLDTQKVIMVFFSNFHSTLSSIFETDRINLPKT